MQRTGRKNLATFRIVVAEKHRAVKKKVVEIVGTYLPTRDPKEITLKNDRIEYWLSQGAVPTDTVASLLKKEGLKDMDKFIGPRDKKAKKKKEVPEEAAPKPAATEAPAESSEQPAAEEQAA